MCTDMPTPRVAARQQLRIVGSPRRAAAKPPEGPFDRGSCRATHHGDYSAYAHFGCLCPDARWDMRRYRAANRGRPLGVVVDGVGAERRLRGLARQSWAATDLARRARLRPDCVRIIRAGGRPRVQAKTHLRIADTAIHLTGKHGGSEPAWRSARDRAWFPLDAWVGSWIDDPCAAPYVGHRRRLEALARSGWPLRAIHAAHPELTVEDLVEIWFGRPASVGAGDQVVAAYDALSMVPGPSVECRDWAVFRRFAPALAWDDDDIDDPAAVAVVDGPAWDDEAWVDPILVERLRLGVSHLGPWTIPQRQWLVADLTDRGRSAAEIVSLLGVSVRTVERDRAVIHGGQLRQGGAVVGSAVMAS